MQSQSVMQSLALAISSYMITVNSMFKTCMCQDSMQPADGGEGGGRQSAFTEQIFMQAPCTAHHNIIYILRRLVERRL